MSITQTKDYGLLYAARNQQCIQPAAADLYGGGNVETLGAGHLMRLDEANITDVPEQFEDISSSGNVAMHGQEVSAVPVSWDAKTKLYANGLESLLLACFGYEDLEGPINYSTTEYSHLFEISSCGMDQREYSSDEQTRAAAHLPAYSPAYAAGDKINSYIVLGKEQGPSELIMANGAVTEFTISAEQKGPIMLEMSGTGETLTRDAAKTTSPNWSKDAAQFNNWFALRHCVAKFGPLGGLNQVCIFGFEIKVTHGRADDLFPTCTTNSGLSRGEPVSTGSLEVEVSFQINKHDTDVYKTAEQAGTIYGLSITATRGVNVLSLLFPHLSIVSAEPEITDGSRINVTAKAFIPTGADPFATERTLSGTAHTLVQNMPFYMVLSNQRSDNSLRIS